MSASLRQLHESLLALYESVIDEYARTNSKGDGLAESRAVSALLHSLAIRERRREGRMWILANAAQRVLQIPVVGPMSTRLLRWLAPKR